MPLKLVSLLMVSALVGACTSVSPPTSVSSTQGSTWVKKGSITEIRDLTENDGRNATIGSVAGAAIGSIVGSNLGGGTGRALSTIGGAAAGGIAGHSVGRSSSNRTSARLTVRDDTGELNTFYVDPAEGFTVGDQVRIVSNNGRVTVER